MLGEALEPVRPVLAAAQRDGEVSAEKVAIIERALEKVDRRGFDPAAIAKGEALLTENARMFRPKTSSCSPTGSSTGSTRTAPCPTTN